MFLGFAVIILCGFLAGRIFDKLGLPGLIGMILVGLAAGPYGLGLIKGQIIDIAGDIRQIALIIILTRAGLTLKLSELKKVGRPAILMCFLPACFEILGCVVLAPRLLGVTTAEAALIGSIIGAVSPAVIVPRMINMIEKGFGSKRGIPQLILAGASADDIFVIILFSSFSSLVATGHMSAYSFVQLPIALILGISSGIAIGLIFSYIFDKINMKDTSMTLLLLGSSFLLVGFQNLFEGKIPFSALPAIMTVGIIIGRRSKKSRNILSGIYNKLWAGAEIFLFVLVGAAVDIKYAIGAGAAAVALILGALIFRMAGVLVCLIKTGFTGKEKLFCMIAYTPKATVQAAIGAVPLSMGLACGNTALTAAVLSILITAPVGAVLIDKLYKKLLKA